MKWFDKTFTNSNDKVDQANQCIEYLSKNVGERPEKWSTVKKLVYLITTEDLPRETLEAAVKTKWRQVYSRIATKADTEMLQFLIECDINDQLLYAQMIYNRNLTKEQAVVLYSKVDDTPRGISNKKALERKYGF